MINMLAGTIEPINFCFWFNGFLAGKSSLSEEDVKLIKSMLEMVRLEFKDESKQYLQLQEPWRVTPHSPTTLPYPDLSDKVQVTC